MTTTLDAALRFAGAAEGNGYHVSDQPTAWGVIQATLDVAIRRGIVPGTTLRDLTLEQAQKIFTALYWEPLRCPLLPPPLALVVFDASLPAGTVPAALQLQRAVRATEDGIVGPKTITAAYRLMALGVDEALSELASWRDMHFHQVVLADPGKARFLRGWFRRSHLAQAAAAAWRVS